MTSSKPQIFLLSIETESWFDELYSSMITSLLNLASVQRAQKPDAALRYLSSNTPTTILITDPYLTTADANPQLLAAVIDYVKNSGTAIFMGVFASFVRPNNLNLFFQAKFALPWRSGDYHRTDVSINNHGPARANRKGLESTYSLKALFLAGVNRADAVYLPTETSYTQSHVFSPAPVDDLTQSPVVMAPVGKGCVGYVGDVNTETGSVKAILAMCGL